MFMVKGVTTVIIEFERYPLIRHFERNNYAFIICLKSNHIAKDVIRVGKSLLYMSALGSDAV